MPQKKGAFVQFTMHLHDNSAETSSGGDYGEFVNATADDEFLIYSQYLDHIPDGEEPDGVTFDCGMMGTFELDGKEYIALEALDDSDDVYLYGYQRNDTDFDLLDIPEEEFDRVAAEFDRLMDEPI